MARTVSFDNRHNEERTSRTTKADARRAMGAAKSRDDLAQSAYEEGLREGKQSARRTSSGAPNHAAARGARAVHRQAKASASRGARQGLTAGLAPVQGQVAGGIKTLTLALGVVGLYLFLQSTTAVAGALGSVARGLAWLSSPHRSIPYAK